MKEITTYSDVELTDRYKAEGNAIYVGELYKRYTLQVYGLAYKYLRDKEKAKDAVTEIFELLLEKLKQHDVAHFRSWLYTLSKNYIIRSLAKNNSLEIIDIDTLPEKNMEKFMEIEPDMYLNIREHESALLQKALSNLNDEQRTCIDLFFLQLKPYQEVASITGYDLNKVKSCIQNGKRNLKLFMEEKKQDNG